MKGLQRSINRGPVTMQDVQNLHFTLSATISITGVAALVDAGSFVIGGLPVGDILILGAVAHVAVDAGVDTSVLDNWDGDYGIGSIPNANLDLADAGDDDIIPSSVLNAGASDKLSPRTRSQSTVAAEQGVILDNTGGGLELNFNMLIDDNFITDTEVGDFVVTGDLYLAILVLGNG